MQPAIDTLPFLIDVYFKDHCQNAQALIDSSYLSYATILASLTNSLGLPRTPILPHLITSVFCSRYSEIVNFIAHTAINVLGHVQVILAYVVFNQSWPIIFGLLWF